MSKVPFQIKEKEAVEIKNIERDSPIPAPKGNRDGALVRVE